MVLNETGNVPSITVVMRQTPEMMHEGFRAQREVMMRPWIRFVLNLMLLLWLAAGVALLLGRPGNPVLGTILVALTGMVLLRPWTVKWELRQLFKKQPALMNESSQWTFSAAGYATSSAHGDGQVMWSAVPRLVMVKNGLLLYPSPRVHLWFPLRVFASAEEMARVGEMAKKGGVRKLVVR